MSQLAARVAALVRETVIPYEHDERHNRQARERVAVLPELMALAWAQTRGVAQ